MVGVCEIVKLLACKCEIISMEDLLATYKQQLIGRGFFFPVGFERYFAFHTVVLSQFSCFVLQFLPLVQYFHFVKLKFMALQILWRNLTKATALRDPPVKLL